jgi:hypothetical protein
MTSTDPPKGLVIVKATYGIPELLVDVTKQTQAMVKNDSKLEFLVTAQAFGVVDDPTPSGVKKTFQILYTLNGGQPINSQMEEGKVFLIDSPKNETEDTSNYLSNQIMTSIFYVFAAYIGMYLICSSYNFGAKGFGFTIIGIIFALITVTSTLRLAIADSGMGAMGLVSFTISIMTFQLWIAYLVSVYDPNFIDFNALKAAPAAVANAVAAAPAAVANAAGTGLAAVAAAPAAVANAVVPAQGT